MFDLLIIDTVMFKSPVPGLRKKWPVPGCLLN